MPGFHKCVKGKGWHRVRSRYGRPVGIIEWIRDVLGEWPRQAEERGEPPDVIRQIGVELADRAREVGLGR